LVSLENFLGGILRRLFRLLQLFRRNKGLAAGWRQIQAEKAAKFR